MQKLVHKTRDIGIALKDLGVEDIQENIAVEIGGGFVSGARTASQLYLLHKLFKNKGLPKKALGRLSQVSFEGLSKAQKGIGLPVNTEETHEYTRFSLLSLESTSAIDENKLLEFGYKKALGCPTAKMPSRECLNYMRTHLNYDAKGPLMFTFYDMVGEAVEEYLVQPIKEIEGNNPSLLKYIDRDDLYLLRGEIPPSFQEILASSGASIESM